MGIFASLVDAVEHAEMGNMPNAITRAVGNTSLGGLAGIVSQLQQAGLINRFSRGLARDKISRSRLISSAAHWACRRRQRHEGAERRRPPPA